MKKKSAPKNCLKNRKQYSEIQPNHCPHLTTMAAIDP